MSSIAWVNKDKYFFKPEKYNICTHQSGKGQLQKVGFSRVIFMQLASDQTFNQN